jgi:hypothetical protein
MEKDRGSSEGMCVWRLLRFGASSGFSLCCGTGKEDVLGGDLVLLGWRGVGFVDVKGLLGHAPLSLRPIANHPPPQ